MDEAIKDHDEVEIEAGDSFFVCIGNLRSNTAAEGTEMDADGHGVGTEAEAPESLYMEVDSQAGGTSEGYSASIADEPQGDGNDALPFEENLQRVVI